MFRVGQKIVCIETIAGEVIKGIHKGFINKNNPKKGDIVTIYRIHQGFLMLEEFKKAHDGSLAAFTPHKFRPLELDYNFVEEVIKQVQPIKEEA